MPALGLLHAEHLADYDNVLPHVFLGDVARYVTRGFSGEEDAERSQSSREAAVEVLKVLEEQAAAARNPEVMELFSVSFLENIDWESPEGRAIRSTMGPELLKEVSRREGA
ncbi:MAG: hypothetical protein RL885_07830 [Planctomycetota bacterium]